MVGPIGHDQSGYHNGDRTEEKHEHCNVKDGHFIGHWSPVG